LKSIQTDETKIDVHQIPCRPVVLFRLPNARFEAIPCLQKPVIVCVGAGNWSGGVSFASAGFPISAHGATIVRSGFPPNGSALPQGESSR